ncbi:hypothetical protein BDW22DRAFT_863303 [Trametopsis cervina]|nr:hypothetical protein BDW22DRAFT_863303 [Trametopsis cervina]
MPLPHNLTATIAQRHPTDRLPYDTNHFSILATSSIPHTPPHTKGLGHNCTGLDVIYLILPCWFSVLGGVLLYALLPKVHNIPYLLTGIELQSTSSLTIPSLTSFLPSSAPHFRPIPSFDDKPKALYSFCS